MAGTRRAMGLTVVATIVAGVSLAGCGQKTIASTVKPPVQSAPSSARAAGTLVGIRGGEIVPPHLIVLVGHSIQWENFDPVGRRLVAVRGAHFRSQVLQADQVFSWTPRRAGVVHYRDALHPSVRGTISVTT